MRTCNKSDTIRNIKFEIEKEIKTLHWMIAQQDIELAEQERKVKELEKDLEYELDN